ncbi:MAG: YggS family pyridoxal phosphate-dependent enzyme [Flavobacteriales bacterium]|nr:MAG: YggS family pyridoxal phosphate-dependent enzyme [Flavobacteriales bacterium]
MSIAGTINKIKSQLPKEVTLVAVSKTKPNEAILEAYNNGQLVFGENKVQELVQKYEGLPKDIEWHLIGHLQSNKVKYIAPFVQLIHAVDSFKLLLEINKQGKKNNRIINCLLQVKIAKEESKFGLDFDEAEFIFNEAKNLRSLHIIGFMGMATFTNDQKQLKEEFTALSDFFIEQQAVNPQLSVLSMGMSGDYPLAIEHGSNMIRVGSTIFGERNYN